MRSKMIFTILAIIVLSSMIFTYPPICWAAQAPSTIPENIFLRNFFFPLLILEIGAIAVIILNIILRAANTKFFLRQKFIDTITRERLKWFDEMRSNISQFAGLTKYLIDNKLLLEENKSDFLNTYQKIECLKYEIKLRITPGNESGKDASLELKLDELSQLLKEVISSEETNWKSVEAKYNEFISISQGMFAIEWKKIKNEAKTGIEMKK